MPRQRPTPRIDADNLSGRTGEIWKAYIGGASQEAIARKHGISQQRVSVILREVKESIPETDRADLIRREVEFLDRMRQAALEVFDRPPLPAYSQGRRIENDDGTTAEDHSERLAAFDRAVRVHERLSKLLGLEAAAKTETTVTVAPEDIEIVQRIRAWKSGQADG